MLTPSNLLCLIVQGGGFKFKKTPQVHLIIFENGLKTTSPHFKKS